MITNGIWCDECRRKYVRHRCKNRRLPCGHDYWSAIGVWCQAFSGGNRGNRGEHVFLEHRRPGQFAIHDLWIYAGDRPRKFFIGSDSWEFWGMRVRNWRCDPDFDQWVGEWLATKPDALVRAFLNRWESNEWVPDWLAFRDHPAAKRACALVPIAKNP